MLAACLVCQFTTALTVTIVGTAAPTIADDLHGLDLYGWIFTAYLLASACTVPIVGRLSDVYGRRPFYLGGLALFLLGSALAGLAPNMFELIGARVIAGIGGGCLLALTAAVTGDIFSPRERGRWQGVITSVWGAGQIGGPLVGGLITDHLGWRWVFYLNLPPGLLAFVLLFLLLPRLRWTGTVSIDWRGLLLLLLSIIPIQLAVTWGGITIPWASLTILGLLLLGLLAGAVFVVNEVRTETAFVSPDLFRNPIFRSVVVLSALGGASLYSSQGFLPLYGQAVLGLSAGQSGLLFVPFILMFMCGSAFAGLAVSRTGRYRGQLTLGPSLIGLGAFAMMLIDRSSGVWPAAAAFLVLGLGTGLTFPVTSVVTQSAFPYRMLGTVTSARQFFVGIGSITSISIMTTVLVGGLISDLGTRLSPQSAAALGPLSGQAATALLTAKGQEELPGRFATLPPAEAAAAIATVRDSLALGLHHVFLFLLLLALVGVVVSRLLPVITLRGTVQDEEPRD